MTEVTAETGKGFPKSGYIERFDGSRWRSFDLGNGGTIILTHRGQEILSYNPKLRRDITNYKNEAREYREGDFRKWFRAGSNSDVYSFGGHPMVIKEASTAHSVWSSLDRMDYLYGICQKFLPSYIKVPDHYGILFAPNLRKQYVLMQKVNDGLTMADVLENHAEGLSEESKNLVVNEFRNLEDKVRNAIERAPGREMMPKELLPDWDAGNVIVDFDSHIRDMPFTFWIIDQ